MLSQPSHPLQSFRVAVLWDNRMLRTQRMLSGFCRRAGMCPEIEIRRFDLPLLLDDKGREPVREFAPHGLVTCIGDLPVMEAFRRLLPEVPIVSACMVPAEVANTRVVRNIAEIAQVARDHFRSMGVESIGLFCGGNIDARKRIADAFRTQVSNLHVLAHEIDLDSPEIQPNGSMWNAAADWLRSLPKPAGVCSLEYGACEFLSRVCGHIGLRIPQDIQLIGTDDVDGAMACKPSLTTINSPSEEIGETAGDVLMQYLRGESPPPRPVIQVTGATLIARGSTSPIAGGSSAVSSALELVKTQATSGMSATDVTSLVNVGRATLYRQFRAETGTTPAELLRQERLREACAMLTNTTASIATIAATCGFGSPNYLAQIFKREIGMSPSEYRQANNIASIGQANSSSA